jgi:hypothetical protein
LALVQYGDYMRSQDERELRCYQTGIWMARDHNPFINADAAHLAVQHHQEKWQVAVQDTQSVEGNRFWLVDKHGDHRNFEIQFVM